MEIELRSGEIHLPTNSPVRLTGARGVRVCCTAGNIWITVSGEAEDFFLLPGQSCRIQRNGLCIIESIIEGRIRLEKPARLLRARTWLTGTRHFWQKSDSLALRQICS